MTLYQVYYRGFPVGPHHLSHDQAEAWAEGRCFPYRQRPGMLEVREEWISQR